MKQKALQNITIYYTVIYLQEDWVRAEEMAQQFCADYFPLTASCYSTLSFITQILIIEKIKGQRMQ